MHKIPLKDNVKLLQVKIGSDDSVFFKADVEFSDKDEVFHNSVKDTFTHPPHKDLKNAIDKFKEIYAHRCGFVDAESLIHHPGFDAKSHQKKKYEEYKAEKLKKIKITGIAISGEGAKRSVLITGTYDGMAMNCRKFIIGSDIGFDTDVDWIVDQVEDETYKYVYEYKRAPRDEVSIGQEQKEELPFDGVPQEEQQEPAEV